MLNELDDIVQENVTTDIADAPLKASWGGKSPGSVAEQMLGVAATIRDIHREIDTLQAEMISRLNAIRKTLGGKA